jgi:hypothetical protein
MQASTVVEDSVLAKSGLQGSPDDRRRHSLVDVSDKKILHLQIRTQGLATHLNVNAHCGDREHCQQQESDDAAIPCK